MNARLLGTAIGAVTLAASGTYVFVYLDRWEWNRALISGVIFVAAEVALATLFLANRLTRLTAGTAPRREQMRAERTLGRLRATAPTGRDHFAWIRRPEQMNVFVPVLMGAGVVLSGLAWGVERLAHLTARPALEQGLARRLGTLAPPADGFVPAPDAVDLLRRPTTRAALR
jgi:hypothetical protein